MNLRYLFVFLILATGFIHEASPFSKSDFFDAAEEAEKEGNIPLAAKSVVEACERFLTEHKNEEEKTLSDIAERTAEIAGRLSITPVSFPEEIKAGSKTPAPFTAEISGAETQAAVPEEIHPLSCTAVFPLDASGKTSSAVLLPETSAGGETSLSFTPPASERGVSGTLEITFTFMKEAPLTAELLSRFESGTAEKLKAVFPYKVMSAKNVPTVIAVLDIDKNGSPVTPLSPSGTELLRQIIRLGFKSTGTADFPTQLASGNEQELYKAAENLFAGTVKRFVYGTVRVEAVDKSPEGSFTASLRAEINTYDFHTKEKTGSHVFKISSSGNTESAAIQKAREDLCAGIIAPELEYAM